MINGEPISSSPVKFPITPRIIGTYTPKDRSKEWEWLAQHRDEYAGQWVSLDEDRLVGHGLIFKEVLAAVRAAGVPDALIVRAERSDTSPHIGI